MQKTNTGHRHGFTLLELLVVIALVSLLMALLLPVLSEARTVAQATQCLANVRSLAQANYDYITDHNEYFMPLLLKTPLLSSPYTLTDVEWWNNPVSNLDEGLLGAYMTAPSTHGQSSVYVCPGDPFYLHSTWQISYNYSGMLQNEVIVGEPGAPGTYFYAGTNGTTGGTYGFNRLYLIRAPVGKVGVFADGFYTYNPAFPTQGITPNNGGAFSTYNISISGPTDLVPIGNFAAQTGSTSVYTGSIVYYSLFHPGGNTNMAFLDCHASPMNWKNVKDKYPVVAYCDYPFAFNESN